MIFLSFILKDFIGHRLKCLVDRRFRPVAVFLGGHVRQAASAARTDAAAPNQFGFFTPIL